MCDFTELDFDWAAAVEEIDRACDRAGAAAFVNHENDIQPFQFAAHGQQVSRLSNTNANKASRQSTLNSFFGVTQGKPSMPESVDLPPCEVGFESGDDGIGIDPTAARTWVYPANIPHREYQFSITKTALFTNTLVSLPTGLGKTLIAAVVMYNYFRWFCTGKIVFTAPSRPLVMQQIEACHNIMGIPQEWTIDMTGQMTPSQRSCYWRSKRVFFVTPQVLEKDIQSEICPVKQLVCLVVDEAHRAMGNYSYCVVIRELLTAQVRLRILALTATPGSKQVTIQTVIDNLQISCLEYRDETDPDVKQYTYSRKLELIQVVMDPESNKVKDLFLEVLHPVVCKLCSFGVFYSRDLPRLTPFEFVTARDKFRQAPPPALAHGQYGEVEGLFGIAVTLYHVYKLLFSHGMRPAFEMLHQKLQQGYFANIMGKNDKMRKIRNLMHESVRHGAPSPKLVKLEQIIVEHFRGHDVGTTRVIIFTNFRESVKDIMEALKLNTFVKAMEFIGQTSGKSCKGQTQKMQQAVLQKFRAGGYNTIVATSIAEEGLDIMEVDLVICFDANISPIRMIQRMGRTGRKRDGRVVVLASEGAELQGYLKKQAKSKALSKHMHNGGMSSFNFHVSPRMVPHAFHPTLQLVHMAIEKFVPRGRKQKQEVVTFVDPGKASLTVEEVTLLSKYFDTAESNWKPSLIAFPKCQLVPTSVCHVKHSFRTTSMLIHTMQNLQGCLSTDKTQELLLEQDGYDLLQSDVDLPNNYSSGKMFDEITPMDALNNLENEIADCSSYPTDVEFSGEPFLNASIAAKDSFFGDNVFPEKNSASIMTSDKWRSSQLPACDRGLTMNQVNCTAEMQEAASVASPPCYERKPEQLSKSSHDCLFSCGTVQVNEHGYVSIASPPRVPVKKPDFFWNLKEVNQLQQHCQTSTPFVSNEEYEQEVIQRTSMLKLIPPSEKDKTDNTEVYGTPLVSLRQEFVAATQDNNPGALSSCLKPSPTASNNSAAFSFNIFGLAELDVVPSSPLAQISSYKEIRDSCTTNAEENRVPTQNHVNEVNQFHFMPLLASEVEKFVQVTPVSHHTSRTGNVTTILTPTTSVKSPAVGAENQSLQVHTGLQVTTPQQEGVKSSNEDWKLPSSEVGSFKRPRRLKRLRKAQEPVASCSISGKEGMVGAHIKNHKNERGVKSPKIGRYQRKEAVKTFFDEEAEVSSDEEFSADEDESESDSEMEGFIDDNLVPASATQLIDDSPVDMMSIYRRSLLTQTPSNIAGAPGIGSLTSETSSSELQTSLSTGNSTQLTWKSERMKSNVGCLPSVGCSNFSDAPKPCKTVQADSIHPCDQGPHPQEKTCANQGSSKIVWLKKSALLENNSNGTKLEALKRKLDFYENFPSEQLPIWGAAEGDHAALNASLDAYGTLISKESSSKSFDVSEAFEEDIFEGLDLDALEAAAAEQCRSKSNPN
ncbi:hypothetical protein O6H91_22G019300 [Diphasiastrum complanatum]|uniref:Uncharacterized protein n=1 Tax=Diphasiastrum complanatum TaxID=34168 RepID=A0ACC2ADG6_DIPCM|nr:hypothetical protein O6H91_22G019300 [Diphasiastrum complanatum]